MIFPFIAASQVTFTVGIWSAWRDQEKEHGSASLPTTPYYTLPQTSSMQFPNITVLLQILCTLPVTSYTSERSFISGLKRIKTSVRSTMSNERLTSGFAPLSQRHWHQHRRSNIDGFARCFPRHLQLANILTWHYDWSSFNYIDCKTIKSGSHAVACARWQISDSFKLKNWLPCRTTSDTCNSTVHAMGVDLTTVIAKVQLSPILHTTILGSSLVCYQGKPSDEAR